MKNGVNIIGIFIIMNSDLNEVNDGFIVEALVCWGVVAGLIKSDFLLQLEENNIIVLAIIAPSEITSPASSSGDVDVPFLGKIAAGTPIEALSDPTRHIAVPPSMLGRGENFYCLEVEGDSMINAGILDGDTVVIKRTDNAENGSIVVALVEGHEVTLKRLRKRNNSVALEAENPAYETRIFGPDQVAVQGELVGLLRQY